MDKRDEGPPGLSGEDRARLAGMDGIATPPVRETVEIDKDTLEKIVAALAPIAALVEEEFLTAPPKASEKIVYQRGTHFIRLADFQALWEANRALWSTDEQPRVPSEPATSAWEAFCSGLAYCEGCHQTKERPAAASRPGFSKWYCDECRGAGKDKR